jgi:hypothetical protein
MNFLVAIQVHPDNVLCVFIIILSVPGVMRDVTNVTQEVTHSSFLTHSDLV